MREIIFLQVGHCGNAIGEQFWKVIGDEHGIDPTGTYQGDDDLQLEKINAYYSEAAGGKYFPRALLMDSDPGTLDSVRSGQLGQLFNPDNFFFGQQGTGGSWAKGHFTEGAELMDSTMEAVQREAERCDYLQGFQLTHSLGGGTGSGTGALLLSRLREEYPDRMIDTFTLMPAEFRHTVLMPYNATLSVHKLMEYTNMTYCFDNDALYNICCCNLNIANPEFSDLNKVVSDTMSCVTSSFRFPGQLNADQRKLTTTLVPFPRLHFFTSGLAPLISLENMPYYAPNMQGLISEIFDSKNAMVSCDPSHGKYLNAVAVFRGKVCAMDVDKQIHDFKNAHSSHFVEWLPNINSTFVFNNKLRNIEMAAASVYNHTSIKELFRRLSVQFTSMFRSRAYLHLYTEHGLDEMEFREAVSKMNDLVADYQQC